MNGLCIKFIFSELKSNFISASFGFNKKDKPVAKKVVSKKPAKKVPSQAELKKLTKVQLIQLAEKENLKVKVSGSKAEVIKSIHSQMK